MCGSWSSIAVQCIISFVSSSFLQFCCCCFSELIRRYHIQYGGKGDILHCRHRWGYWSFAAGHSAAHEFCWNRVLRGEFNYLTPLTTRFCWKDWVSPTEFMLKRFSGSHPVCLTAGSLSPQEASFQNLFHFSLESPRGLYWAPFCSPCTLSLSLTPFRNISLITTNMQMTRSCRKPPFPPISARFLEKLKSVLRMWKTGWTKTNLNSVKRKLSSWP